MSGNTFCYDNSSYSCSNNCYKTGTTGRTSQRNTFTKLYQGINSIIPDPSVNISTGIVIRNSDFTNNFNSVNLDGGMFKILDCTFTGSRTTLDGTFTTGACYSSTSTIKDVELDQTHEYEIYASAFTFTGKDIKHIVSGGANYGFSRIQNNTFTNNTNTTVATDNVTGMVFLGDNTELLVKCNTFTDMGTDIQVGGSNTIKTTQGTSGLGAGNQFSSQRLGRYRLNNSSGTLITYYFQHASNPPSGSDPFNPLTDGYSTGAMGLSLPATSSPNAESTDCQILCMDFISSIKSVNFVKDAFNIIPQPANNEIKVDLINNSRNYMYYAIYDIQGKQIVYKTIYDKDYVIINTSEFNNGIYILRLIDERNQGATKKLLIQH